MLSYPSEEYWLIYQESWTKRIDKIRRLMWDKAPSNNNFIQTISCYYVTIKVLSKYSLLLLLLYFLKKLEKKRNFSVKVLLFCYTWVSLEPRTSGIAFLTLTSRPWKLGWRKVPFMEFLYKLYANSCFCRKKCIFLKRILALPMLGQIRTVSELQPFTFDTFDLGHPVSTFCPCLSAL